MQIEMTATNVQALIVLAAITILWISREMYHRRRLKTHLLISADVLWQVAVDLAREEPEINPWLVEQAVSKCSYANQLQQTYEMLMYEHLNRLTRAQTVYLSFKDLCFAKGGYVPSLQISRHGAPAKILAAFYDGEMEAAGSSKRVFRS